jgi:ubiquinone/menaquinone biosynthesis C-methylase UbiE
VTDRAVQRFYDELAADYDRIFADWDLSIAHQAAVFTRLIERQAGGGSLRVLDCACGIGTQAIGLCRAGHHVVGSDLSVNAVRRAPVEAARRGAALPTVAADLRHLPFGAGTFDVVVCADNALPHLLTPADMVAGLASMARVLASRGLLILTVRDYDEARRSRPAATLPQVSQRDGGAVITFQVWDWHPDGERYDLTHFQVHSAAGGWVTRARTATYWAITRAELTGYAEAAGLRDVAWHEPQDSGYYQPILTASAA